MTADKRQRIQNAIDKAEKLIPHMQMLLDEMKPDAPDRELTQTTLNALKQTKSELEKSIK